MYLYDGFDPSAPLIRKLDGDYSGITVSYTTTQRYMFIRFTSDYATANRGFSATVSFVSPSSGESAAGTFVDYRLNYRNKTSVLKSYVH
jgi:hypothetical protein